MRREGNGKGEGSMGWAEQRRGGMEVMGRKEEQVDAVRKTGRELCEGQRER